MCIPQTMLLGSPKCANYSRHPSGLARSEFKMCEIPCTLFNLPSLSFSRNNYLQVTLTPPRVGENYLNLPLPLRSRGSGVFRRAGPKAGGTKSGREQTRAGPKAGGTKSGWDQKRAAKRGRDQTRAGGTKSMLRAALSE